MALYYLVNAFTLDKSQVDALQHRLNTLNDQAESLEETIRTHCQKKEGDFDQQSYNQKITQHHLNRETLMNNCMVI